MFLRSLRDSALIVSLLVYMIFQLIGLVLSRSPDALKRVIRYQVVDVGQHSKGKFAVEALCFSNC